MDSDDGFPLLDLLRGFAATMGRRYEVNDVLHELGDSAVQILGASGAGISVASDGRLEFVTATGQQLVDVESVQERHQEGPCVEAFLRGEVVAVNDIAALDVWKPYREAAARSGFRSVVGLPLSLDGHRVGSLNVYDVKARDWDERDMAAARVLADIATAYLVRAGELNEARQLVDQLQHALDSRIIIEQAKGMISRDHGVQVDEAFELMRRYSRNNNIPLRRIANLIVSGDLHLPCDGD